MVLATKERITAHRLFSTRRYILSTHPVLYISGRRDFQGTNQFLSDDAYGRLCTRTGALWTPQGYKLDGEDDLINCGYNAAYDITGSVTLGVWFYYVTPPLGDGNYTFLAKGRTASGSNKANYILRVGYTAPNNKIQFYYRNSANTAWHTWTSANDPLSTWNWYNLLVGFTFGTPSSLMVLVNGVNVASGGSWTVGDGTAAPITSTEQLYIGSVFPTTGAPAGEEYYDKIGEVWVYNRLLAVTEGQQIYQVTKWRYS